MDEMDVNRVLSQVKEDEPVLFLMWVHEYVCMVSCPKDSVEAKDEK